jgi:hypothetical protein
MTERNEMSMRNRRKWISLAAAFLSFLFILAGCSSKSVDNSNQILTDSAKLVYEETLSPNKEYVTSDKDIVYYYIKVYQDENSKIIINASSNSEFFKDLQYTLDCDKQITKEDVKVSWTTLMGNPKPSKDDQLCIAKVSISKNGAVFSEKKISFAAG